MFNIVKRFLDSLLSLVYPDVCQICGLNHATCAAGYVCEGCRRNIEPINPPYCELCGLPVEGDVTVKYICSDCKNAKIYFDKARSAVRFTGSVRTAIHLYKYRNAMWFEPFLARLFIAQALPDIMQENWDFIIPVPLHWVKFNERGFNQSQRLAKWLSEVTTIPLNARGLKRVKYTKTQTRLDRPKRSENVRNAFGLRVKNGEIKEKNIVIVDDVMTTGATVNECARILKRAGAAKVCVWTLARGT